MDGILNVNKPAGMTSARTLDAVRRATGQRKSGHAGTLDPLATGVLLTCLNRGTRLVESLMGLPKVYVARARLDLTSRSFDNDGPTEPVDVGRIPTDDEVRRALHDLEGSILQTPPAVSALKVGGVAAYRRVRAGQTVELPPRPVMVYWIKMLDYQWPELQFAVACGRGTYIRALIRDVGIALGTGGCLVGLKRTAIGPFRVEDAVAPSELTADWSRHVISVEEVRRLVADSQPPSRPAN